jgi:tricorn protease
VRGYYLHPDVHGDQLAFVSDDDVWVTSLSQIQPRRLTVGFGVVTKPRFSPDGRWIAFRGRKGTEEVVCEVYVIPSAGGEAKRLTYFGSASTDLAGWTPDGKVVVIADSGTPFSRWRELFAADLEGGEPARLPYGQATGVAYGRGVILVVRGYGDLPWWKRYRGGTRGKFWASFDGGKQFSKFLELETTVSSPMWVGDRLFFISDHEGIGNLYSVDGSGKDMKAHSSQKEYYARNASSDGSRIVYHAGGEIFLFDPASNATKKIEIDLPSPRRQREARLVEAGKFLEEFALHPKGHMLVLTSRGKPFVMGNWEGAVAQLGERNGARYRQTSFLNSDELVTISDSSGEEHVELWSATSGRLRVVERDLGMLEEMAPSPTKRVVAVTTHSYELHSVDLESGTTKLLDKSQYGAIAGLAWAPGGDWLAYVFPENLHSTSIKMVNATTGKVVGVTSAAARDFSPSFDPEGRYLYYLSYRFLDPVFDKVMFDYGFPKAAKPFLVALRKDVPSPFNPTPKAPEEPKKDQPAEKPDLTIDIEAMRDRTEPFPVDEADYSKIRGAKGKVLFLSFPVEGASKHAFLSHPSQANGVVESYDLNENSKDTFASGVSDFGLSADCSTAVLRVLQELRVVKATEKVDEKKPESKEPGRKTGWVDLKRIRVWAEPEREWPQMLRETWRLMRETYWRKDLRGLDWPMIYSRYSRLVGLASTRSELSDVLGEMQGEVGTSHSYEIGGDYGEEKPYPVGSLGAELRFTSEGYEITKIHEGDPSNEGEKSPLLTAGVDIKVGDVITAIDGVTLTETLTPRMVLLSSAGVQVRLKVRRGKAEREATVKTLTNDKRLLYREWVEGNRRYVHEKTNGKVGYVHIPDMVSTGFAEFHRLYPQESEKDALIVDVRYNSGGHVSSLILEKLARRRIGYAKDRMGNSWPYPDDSVKGPVVTLTNEWAGSDGDIFSHSFQLIGLGPLLGVRTWGGVVGINTVRPLVDGTFVTQPQAAFWFKDTGWGVENYGTDPTIEVDNTPTDFASGKDRQLDRTIEEALRLLKGAKMLEGP